jgi:hypothetical protein
VEAGKLESEAQMNERYKLIQIYYDGKEETHIENVSYSLANALRKLLVMQGESEQGLHIEEQGDDLKYLPTGLESAND